MEATCYTLEELRGDILYQAVQKEIYLGTGSSAALKP